MPQLITLHYSSYFNISIILLLVILLVVHSFFNQPLLFSSFKKSNTTSVKKKKETISTETIKKIIYLSEMSLITYLYFLYTIVIFLHLILVLDFIFYNKNIIFSFWLRSSSSISLILFIFHNKICFRTFIFLNLFFYSIIACFHLILIFIIWNVFIIT